MVFDLKGSVKPQVFTLPPVGAVQAYRLVFDLYPAVAPDPLMELLAQSERKQQNAERGKQRAARHVERPRHDAAGRRQQRGVLRALCAERRQRVRGERTASAGAQWVAVRLYVRVAGLPPIIAKTPTPTPACRRWPRRPRRSRATRAVGSGANSAKSLE